MNKTVLVPIDGSTYSQKALEFACEYGAGTDAGIHLLHVAQPVHENHTLAMGAVAIAIDDSPKQLLNAGEKLLQVATAVAANASCQVVATHLHEGDPARLIVATARELAVDMVIIGNRGLGDLAGVLLGSVSHKVSHLAPCTCITVR